VAQQRPKQALCKEQLCFDEQLELTRPELMRMCCGDLSNLPP